MGHAYNGEDWGRSDRENIEKTFHSKPVRSLRTQGIIGFSRFSVLVV